MTTKKNQKTVISDEIRSLAEQLAETYVAYVALAKGGSDRTAMMQYSPQQEAYEQMLEKFNAAVYEANPNMVRGSSGYKGFVSTQKQREALNDLVSDAVKAKGLQSGLRPFAERHRY